MYKLEILLAENGANEDLVSQYSAVKKDLQDLDNESLLGQILRSKVIWAEEGEKSSRYFLNLEKHNSELKHLSNVLTSEDAILNEPKEVRAELLKFYKKLYTSPNKKNAADFTLFTPEKTLNNLDKIVLDSLITQDECKEALEMLPKSKTPGSDGLTTEFYLFFWEVLSDYFYNSLLMSIEKGELTIEQRRGVINIIPKGDKDHRLIKNWRPITVLNVDYKIIAKIIANRLRPVLPDLINQDQTGYVQNRLRTYVL